MKFTQIPSDTYEQLQLNAGILISDFDPQTPTIDASNIIGATSGGVNFTDVPTYEDFAADIDNAAKNTKEFKRITDRVITLAGTFLTVSSDNAKRLAAAADAGAADTNGLVKITPRDYLVDNDFEDLWWIGDYSDKNGATNGGFLAIKLIDALNVAGFAIQTGDRAKGQFAFSFQAHYSADDMETVPYEMYIQAGDDEPTATTNTTNTTNTTPSNP